MSWTRNKFVYWGTAWAVRVALLTAVRDPRIKTLILWSAVAYPCGDIRRIVGSEVWKEIEEKGSAHYLNYTLTKHFIRSLASFQPMEELQRYQGNVLLVHGTNDDVVPVDHCFLYQKVFWLRREGICDKEIILQGDHTFSSSTARKELLEKTIHWLKGLRDKKWLWSGWSI